MRRSLAVCVCVCVSRREMTYGLLSRRCCLCPSPKNSAEGSAVGSRSVSSMWERSLDSGPAEVSSLCSNRRIRLSGKNPHIHFVTAGRWQWWNVTLSLIYSNTATKCKFNIFYFKSFLASENYASLNVAVLNGSDEQKERVKWKLSYIPRLKLFKHPLGKCCFSELVLTGQCTKIWSFCRLR